MYETFYGLKEKPFSLNPDPSFLFLSKQHRLSLTMLEYGINNKSGITVITGEIGSGKTTLIRKILEHVDQDMTVGLISNTHKSIDELLKWVLMAFNLDFEGKEKAVLYKCFFEFLMSEYDANRRTILIIDEAQNLDVDTLEELRMLSNINVDNQMPFQLILAGQPELLETMRRPDLRQLSQRVLVDYHINALNAQETLNYIRHRIEIAGGNRDLIDPYACAAVYYHSGGIPRLINILCDYALIYGFAEDKSQISLSLMLDVIQDKKKGGIFPSQSPDSQEAGDMCDQIKRKVNVDISLLS